MRATAGEGWQRETVRCGPNSESVVEIERRGLNAAFHLLQDDEYRWAGVEDPKIMITTSHDPSARLKKFVKEVRLLFPNAQRLNRGNYEYKQVRENDGG